jgi:hypothetical protein
MLNDEQGFIELFAGCLLIQQQAKQRRLPASPRLAAHRAAELPKRALVEENVPVAVD